MRVAVLGAFGTIGRAVVASLLAGGHAPRVVGRSEAKLRAAFEGAGSVDLMAADLATADGCARAAAGMDAIVYSLGLPYTTQAFAAYPAMMHLAVDAARRAGVRRLLHISNVYSYGRPRTARVREDHPREPCSVKGRWRKEQEDVVLGTHDRTFETLVLRLPDFYGPFADRSLGGMIIAAAVKGTRARMLAPIDTPHEFVFTPDVGPVVTALLTRPDGWGGAYNFGGADVITQREFALRAFSLAGHRPRFMTAGPGLVRLFGLFSPMMRELVEMSYLLTDPVLLDDTKLHGLLGDLRKTPYEDGIRRTIEHARIRPAS